MRKIKVLFLSFLSVPSNIHGYLEKMRWTPLPLKKNKIVFWHQHLPHRSMANKSEIPRVVAYYNLFPIVSPKPFRGDWKKDKSNKEQLWVARQFQRCEFYYGIDAGKYPTRIINIEEHKDLTKHGKIEEIANLCQSSPFRRRLTGQESY